MLDKIITGATNSAVASNGDTFYWNDSVGIGYLKSHTTENIYDKGYWDYYWGLRDTDMGKSLTRERCKLAAKYVGDAYQCIDIGIGNGQFVDEFECYGTDINPFAIEWLRSIHKYSNIKVINGWEWFTLWDTVEHIEPDDFKDMLNYNDVGVVLSTPIYKSFEDCLSSKHFKPGEHILYFTTTGIINYMDHFGYTCVEMSTIETKLGRESIGSFVFVKRPL